MGKAKLPSMINLKNEETKEMKKNFSPSKEVGITDIDFSSRRKLREEGSVEESKDSFYTPKEEKKELFHTENDHDYDPDPTNSFLKYIKYKSQESLGKVHNDSIIEVNAYTDKSGLTSLMIVSRDGLIKLFQEEKTKGELVGQYTQKRSFLVSEREIV